MLINAREREKKSSRAGRVIYGLGERKERTKCSGPDLFPNDLIWPFAPPFPSYFNRLEKKVSAWA